MKKIMYISLALAMIAALGYFLMGINAIHAADLTQEDAPPGFVWIACAFYVISGLLLLQKKRWMLIALSIINVFPIAVFYLMWADRTDVMSSAPGLITKIAQILLEAGLIYLIVKFRQETSAIKAK